MEKVGEVLVKENKKNNYVIECQRYDLHNTNEILPNDLKKALRDSLELPKRVIDETINRNTNGGKQSVNYLSFSKKCENSFLEKHPEHSPEKNDREGVNYSSPSKNLKQRPAIDDNSIKLTLLTVPQQVFFFMNAFL
jgi:hypothetical protein